MIKIKTKLNKYGNYQNGLFLLMHAQMNQYQYEVRKLPSLIIDTVAVHLNNKKINKERCYCKERIKKKKHITHFN